jgi:hypothetical protein
MRKDIFNSNDSDDYSEFDMLNEQSPADDYKESFQLPSPTGSYSVSDETFNEVAYELEEGDEDIIEEAMVRLEQARLYEMLIKHDIFEGVTTSSKTAMDNVQKELKDYIVSRLQVLLGIKEDEETPVRYSEKSLKVELPFNKLEVQALKDIANKLTKGASSENQEKEFVEAREEEAEEVKKPQTLKPLGAPKKIQKISTVKKQEVAPSKPLPPQKQSVAPKKSNVTVNKTKRKNKVAEMIENAKIDTMNTKYGTLTAEEIALAKQELLSDLERSQTVLTEEDKIKKAMERQSQAISSERIPMPDTTQVEAMYNNRIAQRLQNTTDDSQISINTILSKVLK